MQRNLPLDSVELDKFLVRVREGIPFVDKCANPFFYIVKPTHENLSKYLFRRPDSYLFYVFDLLAFGPRIFLHFMIVTCISILRSWQNLAWDRNHQNKKEILFLSHFTHAQDPSKEDAYLGALINQQLDFVFFLNHTRINARKISSIFEKHGKRNLVINSKSLLPHQTLLLQVSLIRVSGWLFLKSFLAGKLKIEERRLMLRAAIWQHSRATMANLTLKNRLTKTIQKVEPNFLVLPLEGHAHEAMIIDLRENRFKQLRIVGYQHAPVVPGQMNLKRMISLLNVNDFCLTTGETLKKQILEESTKCKIAVIGSPKSRQFQFKTKDFSRIQVLVAPEGNKESLIEFTSLTTGLSSLLPRFHFVFRPHPGFENLLSTSLSNLLTGNPNVELSTSTLIDDLSDSHFVLFRSSAVGIEGLCYGAQPVHWDYLGKNLLNPFAQTSFVSLTGKNLQEIAFVIESFDVNFLNSHEFEILCQDFFYSYFSKMQNLRSLLNIS
jgi:hypothetical protein